MTAHKKAIQSRDVRLTDLEIATLKGICSATLDAQPQLKPWVKNITVAPGVVLPFLPIRCFRLLDVSRFGESERAVQSAPFVKFLSSGSTQAQRAKHHMSQAGLSAYRDSACVGWSYASARLGIPAGTTVLSLVPPGEKNPESSLSMMLSFWRDSGVPVHFIDLSEDPAALENFLQKMQNSKAELKEFVLFGTSLHHLQLLQWHKHARAKQPFIDAQRVWCFDTGGTKGRTQSTSTQELQRDLKHCFTPSCRVEFLSEYGMCELASQAYSAVSPHTDIFQCSPHLRALAISPNLDIVLEHGTQGFLGFVDFANIDSWPCVVSEDLGSTQEYPESAFRLSGRAPDATLKGCSLNVRDTYRFDLDLQPLTPAHTSATQAVDESRIHSGRQVSALSPEKILQLLPDQDWPTQSRLAFKESLQNWNLEFLKDLSKARALEGERIAIVTSANIPITWLFPTIFAWAMQAHHVDLHLPSLRPDDPLTSLVRRQIVSLVRALNQLMQEEFIGVHHQRLLAHPSEPIAHKIVVFGSDETVRILSEEISRLECVPAVVALGHFQNSLRVNDETSASDYANLCSLWMGRGCLTPLQLEIPDHWTESKADLFCEELFQKTRQIRELYISDHARLNIESLQAFSHQHNLLEVLALCEPPNCNMELKHCTPTGTVVCNLSQAKTMPRNVMQKFLDFAGCGWINVVRQGFAFPLPQHTPTPSLTDLHQGKTWQDWFLKPGDSPQK